MLNEFKMRVLFSAAMASAPVAARAAPAAACSSSTYVLGFFNGVFNTQLDAWEGLVELSALLPLPVGTPFDPELFYNHTGCRPGVIGKVSCLQDIAETFVQRAQELDSTGVLASRFEYFWELLGSGNTLTQTIRNTSTATAGMLDLLQTELLTDSLAGWSFLLSDPPTLADVSRHNARLDALAALGDVFLLVGHSQGNLFLNKGYDHIVGGVGPGRVAAVHVAPASPTLRGSYVLASIDLVINALRVTGISTVPSVNLAMQPSFSDWTGHKLIDTYLDPLRAGRAKVSTMMASGFSDITPDAPACCTPICDPLGCGLSNGCGGTCACAPGRTSGGAWGDPHFTTQDGTLYDFQYVGEFLMATDDNEIVIEARQAPYGTSRTVAVIVAVAANVNGDHVEIDAAAGSPRLWVNGSLAGPGPLPLGGTISETGISWPDGTSLSITNRGTYLNAYLFADTAHSFRGLIGDHDVNPADDFRLRDGTILPKPLTAAARKAFSESWRVSQAESLFNYGPGRDTTTFTDLTFPDALLTASGLPPAVYDSARAACVDSGIVDAALLDACILDVGATGDPSFTDASGPLAPPTVGTPAVYDMNVDPQSLKVDRVAPLALVPDGRVDGVLNVTVQGPLAVLSLVTTDANGTPVGGQFWDTTARDATFFLGVEENGVLINNADSSLPAISEGLHQFRLYAESTGFFRAGQHFRLNAILSDGTAVSGPVLTYADPIP